MKKTLRALLLTLLCALTLGSAAAASGEDAIRDAVSSTVTDYAAKVYKPNADDEAFTDFMVHGFFSSSPTMQVTEHSNIIAALFNACLTQEALTEAITNGIVTMQQKNIPVMHLTGGPQWHSFYYDYQYIGYRGDRKDSAQYLGPIATAAARYGSGRYGGPTNRNDDVMELLAGSIYCSITLRRTEIDADSMAFTATLDIHDTFDFNSDYSAIADKGYNTGTDERLKDLGLLLKLFGLSDFSWKFQKTFSIEVPNLCDHAPETYHWIHNKAECTLTGAEGSEPMAFKHLHSPASNGVNGCYFRLERPVTLHHRLPWIVEYDMQPVKILMVTPAETMPNGAYFYQYGANKTWIRLADPEDSSVMHFLGVDTSDRFRPAKDRLYTYHLENHVYERGNMVFLTVYEGDTVVYGPEPMDDHWVMVNYGDKVLTERDVDMVSGHDITIRYVGSNSTRLTHDRYALRIWEGGTDEEITVSEPITEATCTEAGTERRTCLDCGYTDEAELSPLGHSYSAPLDESCDVCGETREILLLRGDINGDGYVNARDVNLLRRDFGKQGDGILHPAADINADGFVNARDVNLLRQNFGRQL